MSVRKFGFGGADFRADLRQILAHRAAIGVPRGYQESQPILGRSDGAQVREEVGAHGWMIV